LISKIAKNAVKCCSATVFQGLATVFWRLATVQNGVSDSKITPSDNPFLDESKLSLTLPEPEFEQKSFFVPSDETEQDDEIDRADDNDNDRCQDIAIPAKNKLSPRLQATDHHRHRRIRRF
jgi:hypothetical protein